jgi:hypothetical protein
MGPKTLPTIWGTYMKLVTKYQISVGVKENPLLLYPRSPKGEGRGVYCFTCPSVLPSVQDISRRIFTSKLKN